MFTAWHAPVTRPTMDTTISGDPVALTDAFAREAARQTQWQAFIRKSRLHDVPATFAEIVEAIAVFLGPVTNALATSETFEGAWIAPGPWQSQERQ